jgi:hypothetical protein
LVEDILNPDQVRNVWLNAAKQKQKSEFLVRQEKRLTAFLSVSWGKAELAVNS